jgi:protoporphyrinogen oxidase
MTDFLILGGGIAGLSAAWTARELGLSSLVLEAHDSPGGILDSFSVDGFRFDNAVHLSFATEPEVREIFDRTPYREHDAVSLCWDDGIWLRHPVQNNLYPLAAADKVALIDGLVQQPSGEITNYRDWLVQQYGGPIAARWPLVYTEKYWTVPAEQLGTTWIGPRMRRADLKEVLLGAMAAGLYREILDCAGGATGHHLDRPAHAAGGPQRSPPRRDGRARAEYLLRQPDALSAAWRLSRLH